MRSIPLFRVIVVIVITLMFMLPNQANLSALFQTSSDVPTPSALPPHLQSALGPAVGGVASSIPVGTNPNGVAYDSATGDFYVANQGSGNVTVINESTKKVVASILLYVAANPSGVAYDPNNGYVYVTSNYSLFHNVSVISGTTVTATIHVGADPIGMAVDAANGDLYVANYASNNISIVSGTTVTNSVPVGTHPVAASYDSENGNVYVTNYGSNNVSVVNATTHTVVANIPVGGEPDGIAADVANGDVYVTNRGSHNISVISESTESVSNTLSVGGNMGLPEGVAVDGTNGYVYVANSGAFNVSVINGTTNHVVESIETGNGPVGVAVDGPHNLVYVTNYYSNNVSVIPAAYLYAVTLTENGLPSGTGWSATLNGANGESFSPTITFYEGNGTYTYAIGTVVGYSSTPSSGAVTISGAPVEQTITFAVVTVPVSFLGSILPSGTNWTVTLGSLTHQATGINITFNVTAGTYAYSVPVVSGGSGTQYLPSPASGSLTISAHTALTVIFTTQYYLTMSASPSTDGAVSPMSTWENSGTSVTITATANAGYTFTAWSGAGTGSYSGTASSTSITMNGPIGETGSFGPAAPSTVPVTFLETGLPQGQSWSVIYNGVQASANGVNITFNETYGTTGLGYTVTNVSIGTGSQYGAVPWDGSVTPSQHTTMSVIFSVDYYLTMSVSPSAGGSVTPSSEWQSAGNAVSITAIASPGYHFVSWAGAGSGNYTGSTTPVVITPNGPVTEVAEFSANVLYQVTIYTLPTTCGSVLLNGTSYQDTQTATLGQGTYAAVATACTGYELGSLVGSGGVTYWSSNGTAHVGTNGTLNATFVLGPSVSVAATPNPVDSAVSVYLNATGSGGLGATTYAWRCGDGFAATVNDAVHTFQNSGNWTCTAWFNDSSLSSSATVVVQVDSNLALRAVASLGTVDIAVNDGLNATASGGNGDYHYTWFCTGVPGDGFYTTTTGSPTVTFPNPGVVECKAWVNDTAGGSVYATLSITVNPKPVVSPFASPNPTDPGVNVTLRSGGLGGTNSTTEWLCPNYGIVATGTNFTTAFGTQGIANCKVWRNDTWNSASGLVNVTVDAALSLTVVAGPNPTDVGIPVFLNVTGTGGTAPTASALRCSDGFTSTGSSSTWMNVSHTFGTSGSYTCRAWYNDSLSSTTNEIVITVNALPSGSPSANPNPTDVGVAVTLQVSGISGGTGAIFYAWRCADGFASASATPTHTFGSSGTYVCGVYLNDSLGGSGYTSVTVTVNPPPSGSASANPSPTDVDVPVSLTASTVGGTGTLGFSWRCSDGFTSTSSSPVHSFTQVGSQRCTVWFNDSISASGNASILIAVHSDPVVAAQAAPNPTYVGVPVDLNATSSGGTNATYAWRCSDGFTSAVQDTSHAFAVSGTFVCDVWYNDSWEHSNSSVIMTISITPSVSISTTPRWGGTVSINNVTYTNGSMAELAPGRYWLSETPTGGWAFDSWAVSGGLSLSSNFLQVQTSGSLVADFVFSPTVSFGINPATCGPIFFNGTAFSSGSHGSFRTSESPFEVRAPSCAGYTFHSWNVTGGITVANATSNSTTVLLTNNATLIADYLADLYPATFEENGLPTGTSWSVTLDGSTLASTASIVFSEIAGTHAFSVNGPIPGGTGVQWIPSPASGSITVSQTGNTFLISFIKQFTLTLSVTPSNGGSVSPSTGWYNAGSAVYLTASANPGFVFSQWAGSGTGGYTGTSTTVQLWLDGPIGETSVFVSGIAVSFVSHGLPPNTTWTVTLSGQSRTTTTIYDNFTEVNGTYSYSIGEVPNYEASAYAGNVTVTGVPATETITWNALPTTLPVGNYPSALMYDSCDQEVYVAVAGSNTVAIVQGYHVVANVSVGSQPMALAFDASTCSMYVADFGSNEVSIIQGSTLVATVGVGSGPQALSYDSSSGVVYVADSTSNDVTVLSGSTVLATFAVGADPVALLFNSINGYEFVANYGSGTVSVVQSDSVVLTLTVGSGPDAMAMNATGCVYVANFGSGTVSVICGPPFATPPPPTPSPTPLPPPPIGGGTGGGGDTVSTGGGGFTYNISGGGGTGGVTVTPNSAFLPSFNFKVELCPCDATQAYIVATLSPSYSFPAILSGSQIDGIYNSIVSSLKGSQVCESPYTLAPTYICTTITGLGPDMVVNGTHYPYTWAVVPTSTFDNAYLQLMELLISLPDLLSNVGDASLELDTTGLALSLAKQYINSKVLGDPVSIAASVADSVLSDTSAAADTVLSLYSPYMTVNGQDFTPSAIFGIGEGLQIMIPVTTSAYSTCAFQCIPSPISVSTYYEVPQCYQGDQQGTLLAISAGCAPIEVSGEPDFPLFSPTPQPFENTYSYTYFSTAPIDTVNVAFQEAGLPLGAQWSLNVGGTQQTTTGSQLQFNNLQKMSTFSVQVLPPPGFTVEGGADSSLEVLCSDEQVTIHFIPPTFRVTFQSNVSAGSWSVDMGGASAESYGSTINLTSPEGNYTYSIVPPSGYRAAPSSGSLSLTFNATVPIAFWSLPPVAPNLTVVATIPVGEGPKAIVYDPVNCLVYVANSMSNSVSVIYELKVVVTIPTGIDPSALGVDLSTGWVYVANTGSDTVSIISGSILVAQVPVVTHPDAVLFDPGDGLVYVAGGNPGGITVLSGESTVSSSTVGSLTTSNAVSGLVGCACNSLLYGINQTSGKISVVSREVKMTTVLQVLGGDSGMGPVILAYTYANQVQSESVPPTGTTVSMDANTSWSIGPTTLTGSTNGERWILVGPQGGTATDSAQVTVYYQHQFLLTTSASNASLGVVDPSGGWTNSGTSTTLTATPVPGSSFIGWSGSGSSSYSGIENPVTITVDSPAQQMAEFTGTPSTPPLIQIVTRPNACGTVTLGTTTLANDQTGSFAYGTYPASATPCTGYVLEGLSASGLLAYYSGNSSFGIGGSGTIVATFIPASDPATAVRPRSVESDARNLSFPVSSGGRYAAAQGDPSRAGSTSRSSQVQLRDRGGMEE